MVWRWSKTAASNATADSSINWAEGQAPSSINDSARAEMARVAQYRDDIAGAIVTTGSSTAYVVTSNQVFDTLAHMDGAMIAFTPHATNTGTTTLNVDGLGAKPLRPSPSVELPSGSLILGTPYVAIYNNSDAVWYLHGGAANPYCVPLGGMLPYIGASAPNSAFAIPIGQALSRTTYATLFSLVGTTYGVGDGSTTFNVVDMRGRVPAGYDASGATGRLTGAYSGGISAATLGAVGGEQGHLTTIAELPAHTHVNTLTDPGHTHPYGIGPLNNIQTGATNLNLVASTASSSFTTNSSTTGISITNASVGSGNTHNVVQPTIIVSYILRII